MFCTETFNLRELSSAVLGMDTSEDTEKEPAIKE